MKIINNSCILFWESKHHISSLNHMIELYEELKKKIEKENYKNKKYLPNTSWASLGCPISASWRIELAHHGEFTPWFTPWMIHTACSIKELWLRAMHQVNLIQVFRWPNRTCALDELYRRAKWSIALTGPAFRGRTSHPVTRRTFLSKKKDAKFLTFSTTFSC